MTKPGRPVFPPSERLSVMIRVLVRPGDAVKLRGAAKSVGKTLGEYVRNTLGIMR